MQHKTTLYKVTTYFIAFVWFANGIFCKVLNLVPRHQQIVSSVLSESQGALLTIVIGVLEIILAGGILLGVSTRRLAIFQIIIILSMNVIEFVMVPELLLWGKLNLLFAIGFVTLIYFHEFKLKPQDV